MSNYIDGFVLPIPRKHLDTYRQVAEKVAEIWKEHGALSYQEYSGDDMSLEGTRTFTEAVAAKEDDVVVFGWVVFPSKEVRDKANRLVPEDSRMAAIVAPLLDRDAVIFDAGRMVYGGFRQLL